MIDPTSGAEVFWDHQVGTFTGILGQTKVGLFGGDILSVVALEVRLGVSLAGETGAILQEAMLANPYLGNKRYVSKLQFMDLFWGPDLTRVFKMARNADPAYLDLSVAVEMELFRVTNAPDGRIELSDPRTLGGLLKMAQYGLLQEPGAAARIAQGLPCPL